jgi:hypothetical protein
MRALTSIPQPYPCSSMCIYGCIFSPGAKDPRWNKRSLRTDQRTCRHPRYRHPRESGDPDAGLGPRFRGDDDKRYERSPSSEALVSPQSLRIRSAIRAPSAQWLHFHRHGRRSMTPRMPGADYPPRRLSFIPAAKTWMAGPSPAMTMCDEPRQSRCTYFPTNPKHFLQCL